MTEKAFAATIQVEKFSPHKMLYSSTQPYDCSMPVIMKSATK